MKKSLFRSLLAPALILAILFLGAKAYKQASAQVTDENRQEQARLASSDNQTIRILLREWEGKTRAEIDAYFGDLPDHKRIIADEKGGILMHTEDNGPHTEGADSVVTKEDGSQIAYDIEGPDAATVGEVRTVLYQFAAD